MIRTCTLTVTMGYREANWALPRQQQALVAYDRVLGQYFGMGIMACYRGYRLYDTHETKAVVKGWVDFYKRHQAILDSDIIHVRRPDGHDLESHQQTSNSQRRVTAVLHRSTGSGQGHAQHRIPGFH